MKKLIIMLMLTVFVLSTGILFSSDGKTLFVTKCGACHKSGGEAETFAPTKYASSQWERFFEREKHKRKKDITDQFTADEVTSIRDYLMKHAADSDQPEAVGLR